MNVTERLWDIFSDNDGIMRSNPSYWSFCGTPLVEYLERAKWIDENIGGDVDIRIVANLNNVFVFDNIEDSMAFKLRWI